MRSRVEASKDIHKKQVDTLVALGLRLSSERRLPTLLGLIARESSNLLGVERCSIFLADDESGGLVSEVALGLEKGVGIHVPEGRGVAWQVYDSGKPMIIDDINSCEIFSSDDLPDNFRPRNMMCVPMWTPHGKKIGVMQALHREKGEFGDGDLLLLHSLASMAAVAIDNSRLYEDLLAANEQLEQKVERRTRELNVSNRKLEHLNRRLQLLNILDPLTRIFNRRYLETQLSHYFYRLCRYSTPFAVLMLDIDHFKKINDAHGHAVGDEVLKRFARVLRRVLRKGDLVARIGGEEFTILASYGSDEEVRQLAERVRAKVEEMVVHTAEGKKIRVTASIGVFIAHDGSTLCEEHCMERADDALYQAKQDGRNRVCYAS